MAISTFGKVIRHGWDWLGMTPKNPTRLTGVVEVPEMVECLTMNKADFLRDPNSLQKYYKYRKAIQDSLAGVLQQLGETREAEPRSDKPFERLQKEIDKVVGEVLPDFPELAPLFGRRKRGMEVPGLLAQPDGGVTVTTAEGTDVTTGDMGGPGKGEGIEGAAEGDLGGTHLEGRQDADKRAEARRTRRKRPGLMIGFDSDTGGSQIAWLRGDTLFINALHPGYARVARTHGENLYVIFAAAATLSAHVREGKSPLQFVERFMAAWGGMK